MDLELAGEERSDEVLQQVIDDANEAAEDEDKAVEEGSFGPHHLTAARVVKLRVPTSVEATRSIQRLFESSAANLDN